MGKNPPSSNALQQYAVNQSGQMDVIYQPLYDYVTYAQAGQTQLNFFQNPKGQSGKTAADTNMTNAGMLPAPQKFLVESISIDFQPGNEIAMNTVDGVANNWQDVFDVANSGYLSFDVGSKNQLEVAPLGAFPPAHRLAGSSSVTGTDSVANTITGVDYAQFAGKEFLITPITIPANQNFSVTLNWPTAVPITVAARIGVRLNGWLYRSVQ